MAHVRLHWIEAQRFLGVDSGNQRVVLSAPDDVGIKPAEGLLLALAACSAYDVVAILHKQRAGLTYLAIEVQAEQQDQPPWMFRHIHLHYQVAGQQIRPQQLDRVVDLALNKYCTVRASLHPAIEVHFTTTIVENPPQ